MNIVAFSLLCAVVVAVCSGVLLFQVTKSKRIFNLSSKKELSMKYVRGIGWSPELPAGWMIVEDGQGHYREKSPTGYIAAFDCKSYKEAVLSAWRQQQYIDNEKNRIWTPVKSGGQK